MPHTTQMFIDGETVSGGSGETRIIINPADGSELASVTEAAQDDIDRAVDAAKRALSSWRRVRLPRRVQMLQSMASCVDRHATELARIECANVGRPLHEIREDIDMVAQILRYYSRASVALDGRVPSLPEGSFGFTIREPHGVVALIVPWNYPIVTAITKIAPAIIAGNTCVVKPSELTPLSLLRIVELWQTECQMPPGLINVVTGAGETAGEALVSHSDISFVSFTGGTVTGRRIMKSAARHGTPVALELGGKSANVILADADLSVAIPAAADAIMLGHGQNCTAGSRLLVHESLYDEVVKGVVDLVAGKRMGLPTDPTTQLGPMISQAHLERVESLVEAGIEEGSEVLLRSPVPESLPAEGFYTSPVVFGHVDNAGTIAQQEIFGPVLCCMAFRDIDEAVTVANETMYGLAAGVWTQDTGLGISLASELEAGTVWINDFNAFHIELPYGGKRQSGFGREFGIEGLHEFTSIKQVEIRIRRTFSDEVNSRLSGIG